MKTILTGKVWSGYKGEYKRPPVYIIHTLGINGDTIFIDDLLREFMTEDIELIIKCKNKKLSLNEIKDLGQD